MIWSKTFRSTKASDQSTFRAVRMITDRSQAATSVIDLFSGQGETGHSVPSLVFHDRSIDHKALTLGMDRLAHRLQTEGVATGRTVGICLERSPELIISVLGILKAGAAYVPIDPTYPAERIALMVEDARPPVVITDKAHQHLNWHPVWNADAMLARTAGWYRSWHEQGELASHADLAAYIADARQRGLDWTRP